MRTALVLLFLLAVAAIPGSLFPQRTIKVEDVRSYYVEHPDLAPILDRLWAFDVFGSPWFAAIYLLLFTSLVGCLTPRTRDQIRAIFRPPPAAPKRFERLPHHAVLESAREPSFRGWRKRRQVLEDGTVTVSAEKGYLKEIGNLLFHFSLLLVLVGVGIGSQWGWHANRLLVLDEEFCNTLQQYDGYGLGPRVSASDLPPFCLKLTDFEVSYQDTGMAKSFEATVNGDQKFSVNHPLRLDGANVHLLGHGYAAVIKYTDAQGRSQTTVSPFLPLDDMLTSEGVASFPDAAKQVGFEGLYLPTNGMGRSKYPAEDDPALMLLAYEGDLGMDAGIGGSVYKLDKTRLKPVGEAKMLRKGDTWALEDGGKVEFLGTRPWITMTIRHDPGQPLVLAGAVLLIAGLPLSLYGKRRRVWWRLHPDGTAEAGGLPKTDYPGFAEEFAKVTRR
ncbi:MAG TPA: cytochrome c biogenesis protein ResB [Candidatus Limnocylindrales bacterium]|nr:cytochrome c biogenesis protein ResB [Candidatus Limnocylindrales bacterium]